ncbi:MAG: class A beta-lactamase-related serine hydrolase [Anaerolineaceae bacterium]|nr:MAG: class A beta-lactamase-related serine hydrolase [Anaerolineaceae bacterium]
MPDSPSARAEAFINAAHERLNAPAMVAALIHEGRLIYTLEAGEAPDGTPVTAQTAFRLGALTHALTAYAITRQFAAGALTPQTPAVDVVHSFDLGADGATIGHLLTHTAGLGTARSLRALVRHDAVQPASRAMPTLAEHYGGALHARTRAGEKWCFSNDGYAVLGQILADITAQPYADAMRETVFAPLGMAHAGFNAPTIAGGGRYRRRPVNAVLVPALGACASLDDMVRFAVALFDAPQMTAPHHQLDPRLPAMGYGLRVEEVGGQRIAWLNGQIGGFSAALCIAPQTQTAAILMANKRTDGGLGTVARRAVLGLCGLSDEPPPADDSAPVTSADLRGYYAPSAGLLTNVEVWSAYGGGVNVARRGAGWALSAQIDPMEKRALTPAHPPDGFRYRSAGGHPLIVFDIDAASGRARALHIGLFTLYRRPRWHSLGWRLMLATAALLLAFGLLVAAIIA